MKRGEVWWAALGPYRQQEQTGRRPVSAWQSGTLTRVLHSVLVFPLLLASRLPAAPPVWVPVGPDGAGISVLAVDPRDERTLFAAVPPPVQDGRVSALTRVVRSHDRGASWRSADSGLEGERVIALAVDPTASERVFAVTAELGCGVDGPGGVFRTDDDGGHWVRLAKSSDFGEFGGLGCNSTVLVLADALLLGASQGIWRSVDHGDTWRQVESESSQAEFHTLLSDPRDARQIYAAGQRTRVKSTDGGSTWARIPDPPGFVSAFAIAPGEPRVLYEYSTTLPSPGVLQSALYRSRDAGSTWDGPLVAPAGLETVEALLVDPGSSATVYFGTLDGLFASRDGGASVQRLGRGLPELSFDRTIWYGARALLLDRRGRLLAATTKGLWWSEDAGLHWTAAAERGLHQNAATNLRLDPLDSQRFLFQIFDDLHLTRDGGRTFTRISALARRQLDVVEFDPFTPGRVLAVASGTEGRVRHLLESRDGGETWTTIGAPPAGGAVALAFASPNTLVAATGNTLSRSRDNGRSWQASLAVMTHDERCIFGFEVLVADPLRPSVLYALGAGGGAGGGGGPCDADGPQVYRSADSGLTWKLWARDSSILALDPTRPGVAYLANGATLIRTRDDGRTFETLAALPFEAVTALLVDRRRPEVLYAGTRPSAVWRSLDGGFTWAPLAPGLPGADFLDVSGLAQDRARPRRIYAIPGSGGLWRVDTDD